MPLIFWTQGKRCALLVLILLPGCVLAIGIGPPRTTLEFTPNLITDIDYLVVNTGSEAIDAMLYVKGDLEQYISLSKSTVSLSPRTSATFSAHIALPSSIGPGMHEMRIGAVETQPGQGGTVGARAGVESQLYITAPLTGKAVQISSSVDDIAIGSVAVLHFEIKNAGSEAIEDLHVVSEIADSSGNAVEELSSDSQPLDPGETAIIDLNWTPTKKDRYSVESIVYYDGYSETINSTFTVSEPSIRILNVSVTPFSPGQIAKVVIDVSNEWNQAFEDVYARVVVLDNQVPIFAASSKSASLEPLSTGTFEVYLETQDFEIKEYVARIEVYFGNKYVHKSLTLKPSANANINSNDIVMLAAVVAAAAITTTVIPWFRKK